MDNKKLGIVLIIISILVGLILFNLISNLTQSSREMGCFQNEKCQDYESSLSITHIAVGIFSFIFALGFYLLIFTKGEEAIVKRLEETKDKSLAEEKFSILLKALDPFEKKVLMAIKEQDGITQNTLRLRTNMSKAKLSYVVNELERRKLIKREKRNKTFAIYLIQDM